MKETEKKRNLKRKKQKKEEQKNEKKKQTGPIPLGRGVRGLSHLSARGVHGASTPRR